MADLKKTVSIVINGKDKLTPATKKALFSLDNLGRAARASAGKLAAMGAAGLAAMAVIAKRSIDAADAAGKTAAKIGVTTEALTALRYAAELNGVEQAQFDTALQRLSRRLAEYAKGTGEAKIALEELGISAHNANGTLKSADAVMLEVAERFARMENGAAKTRLAFKLFDTEGVAMINMLNQGRGGINALTDEARKFGVVIDQEAADKAAAFNDILTRLKSRAKGLGMDLTTLLLPALQSMAETLEDFADGGLGEGVFGNLRDGADQAAKSVGGLADMLTAVHDSIATLAAFTGAATATKTGSAMQAAALEALVPGVSGDALPLPGPKAAPFTPGANEGEMQAVAANVEALERIKRDLTNETTLMMLEGVEQMRMAEVFAHEERLRQIAEYGENTTLQMQTVEIEKMFHEQRMLQIEKQHAEARKKVQEQAAYAIGSTFANLAGVAAAAGKEGFAAYKTFAIAEAIISAYLAANRAMEAGPFIGPILAASTLALGLANVATIASTNPGGVAHAGLDFVPQESTFLLQRGERVIQPEANRDLTEFLAGGGGSSRVIVNLDGREILDYVGQSSRTGELVIDSRAIA